MPRLDVQVSKQDVDIIVRRGATTVMVLVGFEVRVGLTSWSKLANGQLRGCLDPCRPSRWTHGADGGKAREIGEKVAETRDPCAIGKAMRLFDCRAVRLWC